MRNVAVSDEVYDKLKDFIVDPFEDTVETVIERLIRITDKARDCWPNLQSGAGGPLTRPSADTSAVKHTVSIEQAVESETTEEVDLDPADAELLEAAGFRSRDLSEASTL